MVAVADVHGAYDQFVAILRAAEIIDADGHWAGGRTHFVQTGDVVDRGPDSRKALDLLMRLEQEAPKVGGRVYALLGNHESAVMLGDVRYTSPAEYEAFRTPDSEAVRERYYERSLTDRQNEVKASGQPFNEAAFRAEFLKKTPLGFVERQVAFGPTGEYGKWLRQHDAVVRINQVVFVHGGISPATAQLGCMAINEGVRAELTTGFEKTLASPLSSLVSGPDGPLWYRGLAELDENAFAPQIDSVLAQLKARAMVGGHTVVAGGHVNVRFRGKVFQIDTGMLSSVYAGGRASALEIKDDTFTAIYVDGRERLSVSGRRDTGSRVHRQTTATTDSRFLRQPRSESPQRFTPGSHAAAA
ncbi:MAG TPA: metallophosphoesterase [Candidatus Limnocylindrales bacterium]